MPTKSKSATVRPGTGAGTKSEEAPAQEAAVGLLQAEEIPPEVRRQWQRIGDDARDRMLATVTAPPTELEPEPAEPVADATVIALGDEGAQAHGEPPPPTEGEDAPPPAEEAPPPPPIPVAGWDQATALEYGYTHPWELSGGLWLFVPRYEGRAILAQRYGFDTLDKALAFTRVVQDAGGPEAYAQTVAAEADAAAEASRQDEERVAAAAAAPGGTAGAAPGDETPSEEPPADAPTP